MKKNITRIKKSTKNDFYPGRINKIPSISQLVLAYLALM
jgi:hypothetical protein